MRSQRIPEVGSIEELAAFWDTHDLSDFEDQLEEVTEPVFVQAKPSIVEISLKPELGLNNQWTMTTRAYWIEGARGD